MKSSLVVLSLVALVSSSAFAASVKFDIQLHEILTLKKVSNTRFEKISDIATGTASLEMEVNGVKKTLLKQALNESAPENNVAIEITGKNTVRIIDQKENINQEIQADINKSLFGGLKTITIKSENTSSSILREPKKNLVLIFCVALILEINLRVMSLLAMKFVQKMEIF